MQPWCNRARGREALEHFMILLGLQQAMLPVALLRRARLACVDRAFRRFCAQHATHMRQHTEVIEPVQSWDLYVVGVSRWLAWHAIALETVHVRFEVRRSLLQLRAAWLPRASRCAFRPVQLLGSPSTCSRSCSFIALPCSPR